MKCYKIYLRKDGKLAVLSGLLTKSEARVMLKLFPAGAFVVGPNQSLVKE